MGTINVGRVLKSPKFRKTFIIHRKLGNWVSGRWVQSDATPISINGVVTAAGTKDVVQVPEGDRISSLMCFHSQEEMFTTNVTGTSDEIEWMGKRYKVVKVLPWVDFGYFKAFGVGMEGY